MLADYSHVVEQGLVIVVVINYLYTCREFQMGRKQTHLRRKTPQEVGDLNELFIRQKVGDLTEDLSLGHPFVLSGHSYMYSVCITES